MPSPVCVGGSKERQGAHRRVTPQVLRFLSPPFPFYLSKSSYGCSLYVQDFLVVKGPVRSAATPSFLEAQVSSLLMQAYQGTGTLGKG